MTMLIIFLLMFFVEGVYPDVYYSLPFDRLLGKFNTVLDNIKANQGMITAVHRSTLEAIKQDMIADCRSGKLQEYNGNAKYDFKNAAGIPTKVYQVMLSKEVTQDTYFWVLPVVNCNGQGDKVSSRSESTPQSDVFHELPYSRLLNKFNKILNDAKANGGRLTNDGKLTLEVLKHDMVEDCKAGRLHEYTGDRNYDFKNSAEIPTKVYHLSLAKEVTQDTYYWGLPEVECNGLDGRDNYPSDDELDEYETDSEEDDSESEGTEGGQRRTRVKPKLGEDGEFSGYIKRMHGRFDKQNKKHKVTLDGVLKPPKFATGGSQQSGARLVHVE